MTAAPSTTNLPDISVSELSSAIKRTMEDTFGYVRVRGEVSGYRGPHSSGHAYFALKDENAKIDAVIWRGVFSKLRFRPEEGMEVVATGRITTFPGSSKYQIVIETLEPAGAGALMLLLEERRKKLAAEGLFDAARKKPIPFLPGVIGVITSPTGAVIRDILHRLADRFARDVYVWPVRVQGEGSAEEVAAAIRGFNALAADGLIPRPDVLIVARGGGSLEDLWGFNEESVVRAAAESAIPLISAIGHETDTTLIDFAADYRAPTPTAAAERAVPVRSDLISALAALNQRHNEAMRRRIERGRADLRALARAMPDADHLLSLKRQKLDHAAIRLPQALRGALVAKGAALGRHGLRLSPSMLSGQIRLHYQRLQALSQRHGHSLKADLRSQRVRAATLFQRLAMARGSYARSQRDMLTRKADRLATLATRAGKAMQHLLDLRRRRLAQTGQLLAAVSYAEVLKRGFALVTDERGNPLSQVAQIEAAARFSIRVSDGTVLATPLRDGDAPSLPKKTLLKPGGSSQGQLF